MKSRNVILKDGFTLSAKVAGVPGHYDAMEFDFRPMLQEDFEEIDEKATAMPGKMRTVAIAEELSRRVKAWSEVDEDGKPVPINATTMRRHPLLTKIYRIVARLEPYDPTAATLESTEETQKFVEVAPPAEIDPAGN